MTTARPHARSPHRPAFTLAELVLSMGIMAVLAAAAGSAILIASKALPPASSSQSRTALARDVLDQLAADLACATSITELTANAITFNVADRGHGSAGPETIRYAWSGTSGAALTRSYNSGTAQTIASDVSSFSLSAESVVGTLNAAPAVMFVVTNPSSLTTDDSARIAKLTEWGFTVNIVSASATQAQFDAAYAISDVLYISDEAFSLTLGFRLGNPTVGIVCEQTTFYPSIGVCAFPSVTADDKATLVDRSHDITMGFSASQLTQDVTLTKSSEALHTVGGTTAAGLRTLMHRSGGSNPTLLGVIDIGGLMHTGQASRSRRVVLPWGGSVLQLFNFSQLNSDARTILKRSLVWAAAPQNYRTIDAHLAISSDPAQSIRVDLFNQPRVSRP